MVDQPILRLELNSENDMFQNQDTVSEPPLHQALSSAALCCHHSSTEEKLAD